MQEVGVNTLNWLETLRKERPIAVKLKQQTFRLPARKEIDRNNPG